MARSIGGSGVRSALALLALALCACGGAHATFIDKSHFAKFHFPQQQQPPAQAAPAAPTTATTPTTPAPVATPAAGGAGAGAGCPSVIEVAQQTPSLSRLVSALKAAGLAGGTLADRNAVQTVFAPNNAAFQKLTGALGISSAALLNRTALLQIVLPYHIVPGRALRAAALSDGERLTTAQGSNLTIQFAGGAGTTGAAPSVVVVGVSSRATVVTPDVPACRSVVHIIDTVLLPQPLS